MDYCPKEFSLYWLNEQLGNDEQFAQVALVMLRRGAAMNRPEHARGTYTLASSATRLIDDWLSEGKLSGYSRGRRIEDFLALTVIPFEGDVEKGIQNLDAMITIKRDELIARMTEEGIDRLPDCLRLTDTAANDGFAQKQMLLNLAIWGAKDLWSEGQFAILLCGGEPESSKTRLPNRAIENAVRAIELAVAVESLTVAHHEQVPMDWDTFSASATVRYFRPADAITWANGRRAEFPNFPQFVARNDSPSAAALPAGMLEAIRPVAPVAADVKQGGGGPQKHRVDKKAIINAFGCREDLFESASKFPWLVEARIKGRAGRNSIAPMYDPVAFATNLPGMTYAGDLTAERAWKILKRSFPLSYEDVSQFDPNEPK